MKPSSPARAVPVECEIACQNQANRPPGSEPVEGPTGNQITLDVCGLQPPEPMERVLDALAVLPRGERVCMLIDREPFPLYNILDLKGFAHRTHYRQDLLYEIVIWHKD